MSARLEREAYILVVDDDRTMRLLLRHALERDGYGVVEAGDGAEALEHFRDFEPDIVLMDAAMPGLDGFDACASLRRLPGGESTPVLIITGLDDEDSVARAFASGASDYINKPVNWAVLRQRVRRMVNERRAEKHVNYLAYHDALTGLPNRTLFIERLEHSLARGRRGGLQTAVMFLDLDGFKLINDTMGHDVGDILLKAVSQRLVSCLRESDTVARLGGDEFTAILDDVESEVQVGAVARRVLAELTVPLDLNGREVFVGASIGLAMSPGDGRDVRTLLRGADMAMYRAKESGRNNYQFYTPDMGDRAHTRLALESHLRRGLDRAEFVLFYQPVVDLATGELVSLEALVRWQHPELGLVSPAEFVPLAEETGLIVGLGEWIIADVCGQIRSWRAAGIETPRVAINLSGRQLADRELVRTVKSVLRGASLDPGALGFELTENTIMHNADGSVSMLRQLKDLGVALAVDDFGTGYSSLSYLKRLPVDTLKIDRSFVQNVPEDADDSAIVEAIVALAHSLRLRVIAEGVEHEAQIRFLRGLDCDAVQGYLCGRPAPAAETGALLQRSRRLIAA